MKDTNGFATLRAQCEYQEDLGNSHIDCVEIAELYQLMEELDAAKKELFNQKYPKALIAELNTKVDNFINERNFAYLLGYEDGRMGNKCDYGKLNDSAEATEVDTLHTLPKITP